MCSSDLGVRTYTDHEKFTMNKMVYELMTGKKLKLHPETGKPTVKLFDLFDPKHVEFGPEETGVGGTVNGLEDAVNTDKKRISNAVRTAKSHKRRAILTLQEYLYKLMANGGVLTHMNKEAMNEFMDLMQEITSFIYTIYEGTPEGEKGNIRKFIKRIEERTAWFHKLLQANEQRIEYNIEQNIRNPDKKMFNKEGEQYSTEFADKIRTKIWPEEKPQVKA